jgi:hypothetical protein
MPVKKLFYVFANLSVLALHPQTGNGQDNDKLQDFEKGSWLFHSCKANIRTMDSANGGDSVDIDLAQGCLDYFAGFI